MRTKLEDGYLSVKNEETRAEKLVVLDIVQSVVEVLHSDFELSSSCDRWCLFVRESLREREHADELSSRRGDF